MLQRYDWPGNIRQLFNAIERASIMTAGITIKVGDLPLEIIRAADENLFSENEKANHSLHSFEQGLQLNDLVRNYVLFSLSKNNHNISRTAKSLGITRATIYKVIHANDGDRHHWRKRHP